MDNRAWASGRDGTPVFPCSGSGESSLLSLPHFALTFTSAEKRGIAEPRCFRDSHVTPP